MFGKEEDRVKKTVKVARFQRLKELTIRLAEKRGKRRMR